VEICLQLDELVKLLNDEEAQARSQGYSTVTLTQEEVKRITEALANANQKILHIAERAA
jgi:5-bromo-4-chloroindolyl phosphate hydrolysis protein